MGQNIISYVTEKFSTTDSRYDCNEQEYIAVLWAVKHYQLYPKDLRFTLCAGSKNRSWLEKQKCTRE